MRSVDEREPDMSLTFPGRRGEAVDEPVQFLDVEVDVRGPRIEPATERLSAALLVAKEAVEAALAEAV